MADIPKAIRLRTRRTAALAPLLAAAALLAAACGGSGSSPRPRPAPRRLPRRRRPPGARRRDRSRPATVTLWVGFTQRELKIIKGVVARSSRRTPA